MRKVPKLDQYILHELSLKCSSCTLCCYINNFPLLVSTTSYISLYIINLSIIHMEAKLLLSQSSCPFTILPRSRHTHRPAASFPIVAVLTRPTDVAIDRKKVKPDHSQSGVAGKTVHNDNWFNLMAINYLSLSVQAATGTTNNKSGYESLVEAAMVVFRDFNFNPSQQHELVIQALEKAFPRPILSSIRMLLPQSKFAREFFAIFTTVFFAWLVGPCEVRESEQNGRTERNVVHIKKCRFLEESNCVGMCTNLCKMPSQAFIKDSLGMPVNMVPNFDDMSCEMIFGQDPPAPSDDPAFKQPCYRLCKEKRNHKVKCTS